MWKRGIASDVRVRKETTKTKTKFLLSSYKAFHIVLIYAREMDDMM